MRVPRIVDAMNYIDDDLVSGAVEYRRIPLSTLFFRKPFLKACACFVAIMLVFGLIYFRDENGDVVSSPFILTAYAASLDDNTTIANVLEQGKKVPISRFESENGLTGFVVSYNKADDGMPSSIAIISAGNNRDHIEEIVGIAADPTQNYYFFIPGENEADPYTLPLFLTDTEANLICQYKITIEQIDGCYYAELIEESIMERVVK